MRNTFLIFLLIPVITALTAWASGADGWLSLSYGLMAIIPAIVTLTLASHSSSHSHSSGGWRPRGSSSGRRLGAATPGGHPQKRARAHKKGSPLPRCQPRTRRQIQEAEAVAVAMPVAEDSAVAASCGSCGQRACICAAASQYVRQCEGGAPALWVLGRR